MDIDSLLEGELASINEVLEQFQTDDKKAKKRIETEEKMLESKNTTVSRDRRTVGPFLCDFMWAMNLSCVYPR